MNSQFGNLFRASGLGSSAINSQHFLEARAPLLPDFRKGHWVQDLERPRVQSILSMSDRASLFKQPTGEYPITYGCSLVQTVFNGEL